MHMLLTLMGAWLLGVMCGMAAWIFVAALLFRARERRCCDED
jgi:hypothetical protein